MATPTRTSSANPQSKSCFRTLPLIYHPKGQKKVTYKSKVPENDIFYFEDKHFKRVSLLRRPRSAVQNARNAVSKL